MYIYIYIYIYNIYKLSYTIKVSWTILLCKEHIGVRACMEFARWLAKGIAGEYFNVKIKLFSRLSVNIFPGGTGHIFWYYSPELFQRGSIIAPGSRPPLTNFTVKYFALERNTKLAWLMGLCVIRSHLVCPQRLNHEESTAQPYWTIFVKSQTLNPCLSCQCWPSKADLRHRQFLLIAQIKSRPIFSNLATACNRFPLYTTTYMYTAYSLQTTVVLASK